MAKQSIAEMATVAEPRKPFDLLENAKKSMSVLGIELKALQERVEKYSPYKKLLAVTLDYNDIKAAIESEEAKRG